MNPLESQRNRPIHPSPAIQTYQTVKSDRHHPFPNTHFLHSISVTHSNYTENRKDPLIMDTDRSRLQQSCPSCIRWEEWAKKTENSILKMENDLIVKEKKLRSMVKQLKDRVIVEKNKNKQLTETQRGRHSIDDQETKRKLKLNFHEISLLYNPSLDSLSDLKSFNTFNNVNVAKKLKDEPDFPSNLQKQNIKRLNQGQENGQINVENLMKSLKLSQTACQEIYKFYDLRQVEGNNFIFMPKIIVQKEFKEFRKAKLNKVNLEFVQNGKKQFLPLTDETQRIQELLRKESSPIIPYRSNQNISFPQQRYQYPKEVTLPRSKMFETKDNQIREGTNVVNNEQLNQISQKDVIESKRSIGCRQKIFQNKKFPRNQENLSDIKMLRNRESSQKISQQNKNKTQINGAYEDNQISVNKNILSDALINSKNELQFQINLNLIQSNASRFIDSKDKSSAEIGRFEKGIHPNLSMGYEMESCQNLRKKIQQTKLSNYSIQGSIKGSYRQENEDLLKKQVSVQTMKIINSEEIQVKKNGQKIEQNYDSTSKLKLDEQKSYKKRLSKSYLPHEEHTLLPDTIETNNHAKKSSFKNEYPSKCENYLLKSHTHQTLTDCSYLMEELGEGNTDIKINYQNSEKNKKRVRKGSNNPERPLRQYQWGNKNDEDKNQGERKSVNVRKDEEVSQRLRLENENLKAYNRVLLEKLSNSRPRKY